MQPIWKNGDDDLQPSVFGARIRKARERIGMTQEELAVQVNKDQRAISEYEIGKRRVYATEVPTFANALRVPLLYFFEDEVGLDDIDHALLIEANRLPSLEAKQSALELVRVLARALTFTTK